MLDALYNFFYDLFNSNADYSDFGGDFSYILQKLGFPLNEYSAFQQYMASICSLISLVFIFVLCCLFVYKIIKLVGNLIK